MTLITSFCGESKDRWCKVKRGGDRTPEGANVDRSQGQKREK